MALSLTRCPSEGVTLVIPASTEEQEIHVKVVKVEGKKVMLSLNADEETVFLRLHKRVPKVLL